jgi:hypothetical protein
VRRAIRTESLRGGRGGRSDLEPHVKSTGALIMDAVSSGAHELTCAVSSMAQRVMQDALWLVGDTPEEPPLSMPKLSRAAITQEMAAATKDAAAAMLRGTYQCFLLPLTGRSQRVRATGRG